MINDGEKSGGDGFFVELGPGPQWVQIDLGASYALHAILAWHYHSQARVYRDVIVQVSDDANFKTGVTTVFNNDHDNTSKLGAGQGQGVHRGRRGPAVRPEGRDGPLRAPLLEREHDERPDPLRRSRGLRHARRSDARGASAPSWRSRSWPGWRCALARLDVRPMHHDEANQAVKFGALLERGEYRYDAHDHHGPTLYYLSLPAALAARPGDARRARRAHAARRHRACSARATILLLPLLSAARIGRTAVAASAVLMALSPAMVFYSRMFIQESLFACFTLAFVIALGRVVTGGGPRLGAARRRRGRPAGRHQGDVGHRPARRPRGVRRSPGGRSVRCGSSAARPRHDWRSAPVVAARGGAVVAALFFSSFLAFPGGVLEPFRGRRHLPRSRGGAGQPRAPVALLPRPARLLLVRRPDVERGRWCWRSRRRAARRRPARRPDRSPARAPRSGRATSRPTSCSRRRSSRPSATRPPGTCCRSTSRAFALAGDRVLGAGRRHRVAAGCARRR